MFGANVNEPALNNHWTPLHYAVQHNHPSTVRCGLAVLVMVLTSSWALPPFELSSNLWNSKVMSRDLQVWSCDVM